VLEPRGDGAALARRAEDSEAGEELEEAASAGADGAVEGGRDGGGRGGDELEGAPAPRLSPRLPPPRFSLGPWRGCSWA
jgi:hypothetical protein